MNNHVRTSNNQQAVLFIVKTLVVFLMMLVWRLLPSPSRSTESPLPLQPQPRQTHQQQAKAPPKTPTYQ